MPKERIPKTEAADKFIENVDLDVALWPFPVNPENLILKITFPCDPIAKSRARKGRHGFYTPSATTNYQNSLGTVIRSELGNEFPSDQFCWGVRAVFYRSNRQRIDCDNLLKTVFDACTGIVWKDDSSVLEVFCRLFRKADNPRTELAIYKLGNLNSKVCPQCGKNFQMPPSQGNRSFCSFMCFRMSRRVEKECRHCHRKFFILACMNRSQKGGFCSRMCAGQYYGNLKFLDGSAKWKCKDCGKQVSRKEYKRCGACHRDFRKANSRSAKFYWDQRILDGLPERVEIQVMEG